MSSLPDIEFVKTAPLQQVIAAYRASGHEFLQDKRLYRLSAFPIIPAEQELYNKYLAQRGAYWRETDFNSEYEKDAVQYPTLPASIKHMAELSVLTFNVSDGVTNVILGDALKPDINNRVYEILYNFVEGIEDIHNLTYSRLGAIYKSPYTSLSDAFDVYNKVPIIKKRIDWLLSEVGLTMEVVKRGVGRSGADSGPLPEIGPEAAALISEMMQYAPENIKNRAETLLTNHQVLAGLKPTNISLAKKFAVNAFNEGVGFMSVFCIIFWFKTQGMCPGMVKANEYILRDETAHRNNTVFIYSEMLTHKLTVAEMHDLFRRGLEVEREFVRTLLPVRMNGMNSDMMIEYVEHVANVLLKDLGYPVLFPNAKNPFSFMNMQGIGMRLTDFFVDPSVTEYSDGNLAASTSTSGFDLTNPDDF